MASPLHLKPAKAPNAMIEAAQEKTEGTAGQGAINTRHERARDFEEARKALLARPGFSVRAQIYLGFALVFLFTLITVIGLLMSIYEVDHKVRFLETVNQYLIEIEQARRFEKNYFLYGTNLKDGLDNVSSANRILDSNKDQILSITGQNVYDQMLSNLKEYEVLINRLLALGDTWDGSEANAKEALTDEVREQGQNMISLAAKLALKERQALTKTISRARRMHIYFLLALLAIMTVNSFILARRVLDRIEQYKTFAQRIASGDYTLITPKRSYRDEFTELALAVNQMVLDVEAREALLIQSHKLRAVGTLTAGVAHELNNPINNIMITGHMFLEDYESTDDEERIDMMNDVVNEANRAKAIIANLLDFARESGSQLAPLDMAEMLKDTIALASNRLKRSKINIDFSSTDKLPRVHGDSQQLRQVFLNLILNAIDASQSGGNITVTVLPADEPHYIAVKVIDYGTGIPKHILSSIFDPFFTTKPQGKGTGLGLSMSQGIITKHGGQIRVFSQEGHGTTFTVTLPVTTFPAKITDETHVSPLY
ncbi:sensor histidine kinase [Desulfatibacillum aliphaticivorans]|uniref:sensor histidine kinase n=1 Tax=Desulfatibacillum aliphaticivorans TaxID=218208 RepID=UPI00200B8CF3|nr:HAMP domain-containing sensor histidine kinase [Desulfatibacillum aliphaticivorans]